MQINVLIFVRRHANHTYTVTVPAQPDVSVYGPTLEECKDEVSLALIQRLEEMDPAHVTRLSARSDHRLEQVTVDLHPKRADGRRRRETFPLRVSLILTPSDDQLRVQAPRLRLSDDGPPLSFYVRERAELAAVAQQEITEHCADLPLEALHELQATRYEHIETIPVTFKPKSPVRSTKQRAEEAQADFWALKASGVNLTAQAKEGQLGRAYRRDGTVAEVLEILASEQRASLVLVGESGVGKTAVVHEVARRLQRKECPEALHDRQLWSATAGSLLAGMKYIGEWQAKLTNLVQELRKKRHILFVEDVAALADAGRYTESAENMADFLKPYVQSGDVVILGESNPARLRYAERRSGGFLAQLRTVPVAPTGVSDTLSILTSVARGLEKAEPVRVQPAALEAAVELTRRFLPYQALPGKAVRLLQAATNDAARRRPAGRDERVALDRRHIVASFTRQTGLPEFMLSDARPLDLDRVHGHFAEQVIGQPGAVDAMADLVAVVKAGLNDPQKPLGVYLFIGPTGVGKTQMAKALAAFLFGDESRLLRFDMSEYMDPAGLRRLIGQPGGGGEGELTGRVRAQPFSVVLLDEFEKADPQIYDLFLQVMGEGRLTDATGETTSFQNAIVLLTSNLGAGAREQRGLGLAGEGRGDDGGPDPDYWRAKIEQYFRPEFINRIDQVVVFQPLGPEAMRRIARRELDLVAQREGLVRRGVTVHVDDSVLDLLVDEGFTTTYGARPLKRAIERLVVLPMARFLAGRTDGGGDLLRLRRDGNAVTLSAQRLGDDAGSPEPVGAGPARPGRARRGDDPALVEGFADLRLKLQMWAEQDDVRALADRRGRDLAAINKSTFWFNQAEAQATLERFNRLDRLLKRLRQLTDRAEYLEELAGLVQRQRDASYRRDLAASHAQLARDVEFLEIELLTWEHGHHDRACLLLRPVGPRPTEQARQAQWTQLAVMYGRWALRKGYEVAFASLEPLRITPERAQESRERLWAAAAAVAADDDLALLACADVIAGLYPFGWRALAAGDGEALSAELATLDEVHELAITLAGANVYGFLAGEGGLHRINEKLASGGQVQGLVELRVLAATGPDPLSEVLCARGLQSDELLGRLPQRVKATLLAARETDPPEVVRVYQLTNPRHVRDPRTAARHNDVKAVLAGDLDDFVLAYLRQAPPADDEV